MRGRLILVRHSVPEIDSHVPAREWKLSEEGKERAERLAESLIRYQPKRLFSSSEPKAYETAEILSKRLHLPVAVIDGLHEHQRSSVPFLSKTEYEAAVREFFEKSEVLVFGSETANKAYERFCLAIFSAMSADKDDTSVIVSHGTVMSLFVSRLTGQPGFQIWSNLGMPGFIILDMQSKCMVGFENIL